MSKQASSGLLENVKTIVYAGLIAVGIRTVAFEPFNIPSGSMKPTLLVGDYLFVSKYSYGYSRFSMPFSPNLFDGRLFGRMPDRGDVAVFRWPRDDRTDYIKRIVGLPGDRIQMRAGALYLNGEAVPRQPAGTFVDNEPGNTVLASMFTETLPGDNPHQILKRESNTSLNNTVEYTVPPGTFSRWATTATTARTAGFRCRAAGSASCRWRT